MKKIIMACTVAAMLVSSVMCVSAENLPEYKPTEDGTYVVDAYNTNTVADKYYGVVVVKGTNAAGVDLSDTDSILYIDQVTADAEGNVVIDEFMSKIDPDDESFTGGTIYIGGEGLETATAIGYIVAGEKEEETFTISGTVSGYVGTTLPTVKVSDATKDYDVTVNEDGTFSVDVPVLTEGSYTLKATKKAHLSYTKSNITEATTVDAKVYVGDLDNTGGVDIADVSFVAGKYNTNNTQTDFVSAYDVDETGGIDIADVSLVAGKYNTSSISE